MILLYILLFVIAASYILKLFSYIRAKTNNEISQKLTVLLNGISQKILVEGKKKSLPVLIMLHGGPGVAFPFGGCCRGALDNLTDHFITVYWDQYGCGNNYRKLSSDLTIADYDEMTKDLITYLSDQYPDNEIYLFGISWGSVLAARAAAAVPEKLTGVFTYGQVLSFARNNEIAAGLLDSCVLTAAERELLKTARTLGCAEAKDILDDLIDKYTNGSSYKEKDASNKFFLKLWVILFSPDYTLIHHLLAQIGYLNIKKNTDILAELASVDISESLAEVSIPYYIMQGRHDLTTATSLVSEFIKHTDNPHISMAVYDKSSHMPSGEDLEKVLSNLVRQAS